MLFILRKLRAASSLDRFGVGSGLCFLTKRYRMKLNFEREQMDFSSTMNVLSVLLFLLVSNLANAKLSEEVTELQIDVKYKPEKCSIQAHKGDRVKVHYRGSLTDGTVFDSSHERDDPIEFELGAGQVIQGWEEGVLGMCLGEQRELKIPAKLGYGEHGFPPTIPGGATLVFDTEVVGIAAKSGSSELKDDMDEDVADEL